MDIVNIGCVIFASIIVGYTWSLRTSKISYPPGPPADPIIGHARLIPMMNQADWFSELGKTLGDVIFLRVPGRNILVLNSREAVSDLLEKRSAIYSDRPRIMTLELMGWKRSLPFISLGNIFRTQRRILQDYLNPRVVGKYQKTQEAAALDLARNLAQGTKDHERYLERFSASIILSIVYGHQVEGDDDEFLQLTEQINYALGLIGSPGRNGVDMFPILRFFPRWFPGAYYGALAQDHSKYVEALHELPFSKVVKDKTSGSAKPSLVLHYLDKLEEEHGDQVKYPLIDVKHAAAITYAAGGETTSSTLSYFLLAMLLHPKCQDRAQKEIDDVIGPTRLPNFGDRGSLPYLNAIYQEVLRWHSVGPIPIPRSSSQDDVYRGWLIPKGTIILTNIKAMAWDPRLYENPEVFNPSRYLPKPEGNGEPYPEMAFGFGRRACPGKHLADASLWIAITMILATVKITKALDEDGNEITPALEFTSGLTVHPAPFPCNITARSEATLQLIRQTFA